MGPSQLVLGIYILGWIAFWLFSWAAGSREKRGSARPESARARRQLYAIAAAATALYTAGFWGWTSSPSPVSEEIALAVFSAGILLAMSASWNIRFLSFREMAFSMSPKEVRAGPYRFMRHPMYAGMALAFLGSLLAYPTVIGAASFALILVIFWTRASAETRMFTQDGSPDA